MAKIVVSKRKATNSFLMSAVEEKIQKDAIFAVFPFFRALPPLSPICGGRRRREERKEIPAFAFSPDTSDAKKQGRGRKSRIFLPPFPIVYLHYRSIAVWCKRTEKGLLLFQWRFYGLRRHRHRKEASKEGPFFVFFSHTGNTRLCTVYFFRNGVRR